MAQFKLRAGERVLSSHRVSLVDGRSTLAANLYLTNERVVVTGGTKATRVSTWFFAGPLLWALGQIVADSSLKIVYQIPRNQFAGVEAGDGDMAIFRNNGDGYAHISFAITRELMGTDSTQTWQQRMHAWASGTDEGTALPTATVIEK